MQQTRETRPRPPHRLDVGTTGADLHHFVEKTYRFDNDRYILDTTIEPALNLFRVPTRKIQTFYLSCGRDTQLRPV